jgi:hypothetical protein
MTRRMAALTALVNTVSLIAPAAAQVDETTLARGNTQPFYSCTTHSDCMPGSVCVDNAGDKAFYCKPICSNNAQCKGGWPQYPNLACYPHRRADGSPFPYKVCNDAPSQLAPTSLASVPPAPPPIADFTWNQEQTAGDCHTLPGAHLQLSPAPAGIDLHYTAQMKTVKSGPFAGTCVGNGDKWHVTWHFQNSGGQDILVSPQADLPPGATMCPQFGNYGVDYHVAIPGAPQILQQIDQVLPNNAC